MRNKKGLFIAIIIILVLLLLTGGALAYVYFYKGASSSAKAKFYTHFAQIQEPIEQFADSFLASFLQEGIYTSKTDLTFEFKQADLTYYNDFSFHADGKVNYEEQRAWQDFALRYQGQKMLEGNYGKDKSLMAVTSAEVVDGYVAISEENIFHAIEDFEIIIPLGDFYLDKLLFLEKVNFEQLGNVNFTQIFSSYINLIAEKIPDNCYKENKADSTITLSLSSHQYYEILYEVLQNMKQDAQIQNVLLMDTMVIEQYQMELKQKINSETSEENAFQIVLVVEEQKLEEVKVIFQKESGKDLLIITNSGLGEIQASYQESSMENPVIITFTKQEGEYKKSLKISYEIFEGSQFIKTIFSYDKSIKDDGKIEEWKWERNDIGSVKLKRETVDQEELSISTIDQDKMFRLDENPKSQSKLLTEMVIDKVGEIVSQKVEDVRRGFPVEDLDLLEEARQMNEQNGIDEQIRQGVNEIERAQVETQNGLFLSYQGEQTGTTVRELITKIHANNLIYKDEAIKKVNILLITDALRLDLSYEVLTSEVIDALKLEVDVNANYKVEFIQNEQTGYINWTNIEIIL